MTTRKFAHKFDIRDIKQEMTFQLPAFTAQSFIPLEIQFHSLITSVSNKIVLQ